MATDSTLTREQLSTLFLNTELGGNTRHLDHFSYAQKGASTYSFGLVQFDVGGNLQARRFLRDNGFTDGDIALLSQQGGLSTQQLAALDAKLQAIPQARMDELTNAKLDSAIERVDQAIAKVRATNPAAADAIAANPELQLAMADYDNQFGSMGPQFISYLAGNAETLQGGTVQAGNPPTRGDVQNFVDATKYGIQSQAAVASRDERFDRAMVQIGITPTHAPSHGSPGTPAGNGVLVNGSKGDEVQAMQQKLSDLGYLGKDGKPLVADGDFGPGTVEAVKQFQRDHHLTVDGKAGGATLGALEVATQQRAQAAEPTMATPGHADNPRYQQVVEKLEALEEQRRQGGLSPLFNDRSQLENAAGQVAYESKLAGMSQVDTVLARPDNQGVFAVQGQLGDPAMHRTYVDLSQAVNQNLQDSTRQSQALDNELSQRQTQEQIQTQQSMSR
ncbi:MULTISPECIES: peptidoglycan-binding domain-containing protein [Stenotrophomonas maltophilia group]|uniref:peptidoglycan-binding domain-containing protein n=1 Tax=Stenotrophomonas maltophilia group TaxID=995085 RepID=UPI001FE99115|nr:MULTISPECIES: peptidoglycan-binding domain-containing protein [Stenotrophomonas maltophilia group]MCZ7842778.1 peptidoglycan-binding protein [Stenotrophomonas maltophilia]MDJ1626032.1 peptidoglycan-binding domain-containing protein [Stenotrophomonas sepilia]